MTVPPDGSPDIQHGVPLNLHANSTTEDRRNVQRNAS